MKRLITKTKGLVKGMPTAVLFSILFHVVIALIAGVIVVKKAIEKKEVKFVPVQKVVTKTIPLKKPMVKTKTKPSGGSTRIVSKTAMQGRNFAVPEVVGDGKTSFGTGGIDSFNLTPDLSDLSMFGGKSSTAIGNDFVGTFYAMNYDRQGKNVNLVQSAYLKLIRQFLENDWSPQVFAPYFRSKTKLYATQFFVPRVPSEQGPIYFGMGGKDFEPAQWLVHYKGKIAHRTGGKFRFRGFADDIMCVRINKKLVLNASVIWGQNQNRVISDWRPELTENRTYSYDKEKIPPMGDWFELKAGEPVEMEVLLGETPGGYFTSMLVVEEYGQDYSVNTAGGPILPIFKTAEMPESVKDQILYLLDEDKADLDNTLMFNVN